jgi:Methyltransferase domain
LLYRVCSKFSGIFATGIKDAIGDLLQQFPGKTIQVLDAGCGPYALLPLLATQFFSPQQVQFTVVDIFEENLASAKTLISNPGLTAYFSDFILTDATTFQWPGKAGPDIVISETMNKAFEKEPQVAITLNLAVQMPPHGIKLPQTISVTLQKINASLQQKALAVSKNDMPDYSKFETELGMVLTLDKSSTLSTITGQPLYSIVIPAYYDEARHKLQYFTTITVYKNYQLERSDCSLTLPLNVESYGKKTVKAGDTLDFFIR